mgnify:CR=1 FL=1
MGFIDEIKAKAKADKKTIVLPESEDILLMKLAQAVLKEGIADVVIVGSEEEVAKNKGNFDISGAKIVDPAKSEKTESYIAKLVELRQKKRNDRGTGKRNPFDKLSVLRRYDGKNAGCRRNGFRSMPFYSRYPASVSADS